MNRRLLAVLSLSFALAMAMTPAVARAAVEPYDDFSSTRLDSTKWKDEPLDFVRMVDESLGCLVSKIGGHGGRNFTSSSSFLDAVTSIRADVTVLETVVDTSEPARAFARIGGFFYNAVSALPMDPIGDVFVELALGDRGNGLELWWFMSEQTSSDYSTSEIVSEGTVVAPGTLTLGTRYTLSIMHHGANDFTFTIADAQSGLIIASSGAQGTPRQGPPFRYNCQMDTGINKREEHGYAYIHANFDNVYLNDSSTPFETFDTSPLSSTRWHQPEYVKEITDGRLKLAGEARSNIQQNVSLTFPDYLAAIKGDVVLSSESRVPVGDGRVRARLQGLFYNESRGPGSGLDYDGYLDDVYAHVCIDIYGNGTKRVTAYVERATTPDFSRYEQMFWKAFTTPVDLDEQMSLSIRFTGTEIIFRCNEEEIVYLVTGPIYPPSTENETRLLARSQPTDGGGGYVVAYFDNIEVEKACFPPFTDVSCADWDWAAGAIAWAKENGITTGYPDGTYRPDNLVSREEMAAFIVRALYGESFDHDLHPYFQDVSADMWSFKYVQRLFQDNITTGCAQGLYCPFSTVTRAQMAAFLVRAKVGDAFDYDSDPYFPDVSSDAWYFKYVQKLKALGITQGYPDGTYQPENAVTRAEMAVFLSRAFQ